MVMRKVFDMLLLFVFQAGFTLGNVVGMYLAQNYDVSLLFIDYKNNLNSVRNACHSDPAPPRPPLVTPGSAGAIHPINSIYNQ